MSTLAQGISSGTSMFVDHYGAFVVAACGLVGVLLGIRFLLSRPSVDWNSKRPQWPLERPTPNPAFATGAGSWVLRSDTEEAKQRGKLPFGRAPDIGRAVWEFRERTHAASRVPLAKKFDAPQNPNAGDRVLRALARPGSVEHDYREEAEQRQRLADAAASGATPPAVDVAGVTAALRRSLDFLWSTQNKWDGHWAADYGGPMFLLPGLVFACHICGTELPAAHKQAMLQYLYNHQQADGGWGLHIESPSTMFGSVLNYVCLRLLGEPATSARATAAREFIHRNGGAVRAPSWGKFWLCVMNLYSYEGINPIPAELWLLPYWVPFHPGRMWCHCRMVYLPMSYLYSARHATPVTPLLQEIRGEIHVTPYHAVPWARHRNDVSELDLYFPHSRLMRLLHALLLVYERLPIGFLRRRALAFALEYIHAEDEHTNYVDIGPVNKTLNMAAVWFAAGCKRTGAVARHEERLYEYMWLGEDGMKMQGYTGSQLWDTCWIVQAMAATGLAHEAHADSVAMACQYVDNSQVREDVRGRLRYYREVSKGGWPFSTRDHGWPITDCTSEGLKVSLMMRETPISEALRLAATEVTPPSDDRLFDSVNLILSVQNDDGGWGSYERQRSGAWMELLNPAELYGDIMVDYSWTECTSACVQSLIKSARHFPQHRTSEVSRAITRGLAFLRTQQREDGSWYGAWAVCFCYGTWFAVEALAAARAAGWGEPGDAQRLARAGAFLLSKQRADGGWSESFLSCVTKTYVEHEQGSLVVNTAWALLTLLKLGCTDETAMQRAAAFIVSRQLPSGEWLQEAVSGIFNRNCAISYTLYRNSFSLWALGRYRAHVQDKQP